MSAKWGALTLVTLVSLSACTTVPNGKVLPGVSQRFEESESDDAACRQWASGPSQRGCTPPAPRYPAMSPSPTAPGSSPPAGATGTQLK